jgi:hypothetical protein
MVRADAFHQTVVAGRDFEGVIASTGTPFICCMLTGEGTPLDHAVLQWAAAPPEYAHDTKEGWWLLRGEGESGVFLAGFTAADASQLGEEFGIPAADVDLENPALRREYFLSSPAWEGLRAWVERDRRHIAMAGEHVARKTWWYARALHQLEVLRKIEAFDS